VEALFADAPVPLLVPVAFPVMFKTPVPVLFAAGAFPPLVTFPVTLNVPVDVFVTAIFVPDAPDVQFPTMLALLPEVPAKVTHVDAAPLITLAVNVTPLDRVKDPPLVEEFPKFLTSPTVVLTFTVMAKLFECRTSAVVNVLQTSDAVPVGVVAQTSVASMFPAFLAK
jgi:hypothetical protein